MSCIAPDCSECCVRSIFCRQFHNLKAMIQLELTQPEPRELMASFPQAPVDGDEGSASDSAPPLPSPTMMIQPSAQPPLVHEAESSTEPSSDCAPASTEAGGSEVASESTDPLSSTFAFVRDSLRGVAASRPHVEFADEPPPDVDPGAGEATDLMRHAAALSANGFFRVSAVPKESQPTAVPPLPTDEEQRWLDAQVEQMEESAARTELDRVQTERAASLPSLDEQTWLDRQLSDAVLLAEADRMASAMDAAATAAAATATASAASATPRRRPAAAITPTVLTGERRDRSVLTAAEFREVLDKSRQRYRVARAS